MQLAVVNQNVFLLRQALDLMRQVDERLYAGAATDGSSAGIGPHLRHCLDFYRCFETGLQQGRIDYDERRRLPELETRPGVAILELERTIAMLEQLPREDQAVEVRADVGPGEDPEEAWCKSSLLRELRFLVSHTVHHYALIAMVLRGHGIEPGKEFGVAPSTLAYWSETAECAR